LSANFSAEIQFHKIDPSSVGIPVSTLSTSASASVVVVVVVVVVVATVVGGEALSFSGWRSQSQSQ
jgi:hypothetical protein